LYFKATDEKSKSTTGFLDIIILLLRDMTKLLIAAARLRPIAIGRRWHHCYKILSQDATAASADSL